MGGQLDGNFFSGSLQHKFTLIVTVIISFVVNNFSLSLLTRVLQRECSQRLSTDRPSFASSNEVVTLTRETNERVV